MKFQKTQKLNSIISSFEPEYQDYVSNLLTSANTYKRLAGYFTSSVLPLIGNKIKNLNDNCQIICNCDVNPKDVATSKLADKVTEKALIKELNKEWKYISEEEHKSLCTLLNLIQTKKIEIRIIPTEKKGFQHGKMGMVTYPDKPTKLFLGSANETFSAFRNNHEIIAEIEGKEAEIWFQNEFKRLWEQAVPLSNAVIQEIEQKAKFRTISHKEWEQNPKADIVYTTTPIYKDPEGGLYDHQVWAINKMWDAFLEDDCFFLLADHVGLGKTLQIGTIVLLQVLKTEKDAIIIVPKTLMQQWTEELHNLLGIPAAYWENTEEIWKDANGNKLKGDLKNWPRKIGIVSQSLFSNVNESKWDTLLSKQFVNISVDEAHKFKYVPNKPEESSKLGNYLSKMRKNANSIIVATATPIQKDEQDLTNLLQLINKDNKCLFGRWNIKSRKRQKIHSILKGTPKLNDSEIIYYIKDSIHKPWQWTGFEHPKYKKSIITERFKEKLLELNKKEGINAANTYSKFLRNNSGITNNRELLINHNPLIWRVIQRTKTTIKKLDPTFNRIICKEFKDEQNKFIKKIEMSHKQKLAYELAKELAEKIAEINNFASSLLRTLLLQRISSSLIAGIQTVKKLTDNQCSNLENIIRIRKNEELDIEDFDFNNINCNLSEIIPKAKIEEIKKIAEKIENLIGNQETKFDQKYLKTKELLNHHNFKEYGCIVFSQYYDTASTFFDFYCKTQEKNETYALYSSESKSYIYENGKKTKVTRSFIKDEIKSGKIKVVFATDAAAEGLNLQKLSRLINIDMPWNPAKIEQRIGRIYRIGQQNNCYYVNLSYKDSMEAILYDRLSDEYQNIALNLGILPTSFINQMIENPKMKEKFNILETEHSIKKYYESDHYTEKVKIQKKDKSLTQKLDPELINKIIINNI